MALPTLAMVQMPTGQVGTPLITVQGFGRGYLENEAAQNLRQQRAPMTIEQWSNLLPTNKSGTSGWWTTPQVELIGPRSWAGKASSYLLDAAELTEAIEDTVFNGSYYYGIHVDSQLISPDNSEEFLPRGRQSFRSFPYRN